MEYSKKKIICNNTKLALERYEEGEKMRGKREERRERRGRNGRRVTRREEG